MTKDPKITASAALATVLLLAACGSESTEDESTAADSQLEQPADNAPSEDGDHTEDQDNVEHDDAEQNDTDQEKDTGQVADLTDRGCEINGEGHIAANADCYGDEWPLTVDEGILRCESPDRVIIVADGEEWGVNGMALTHGYQEIDPIWADNPNIDGAKIDIGPLIDDGLDLCG